jgi:predicted nucleic acid-binding protein
VSAVLVDSNVLLDRMTEDERWFSWSERAIEHAARAEDLDAVLPRDIFEREAIPYEAAFLAGKCFAIYRRRGGAKSSPLPDFFIGAHAAVAGYRLLTRDAARYRTFFRDWLWSHPSEVPSIGAGFSGPHDRVARPW